MFGTSEPCITIKLKPSTIEALRLEPDPNPDSVSMAIGSASAKVGTIIDCALVLAAEHFPLLTKAMWVQLINEGGDYLVGDLPAAQVLAPGFLGRAENSDEWDLSDQDMEELASLSSAELFAVHLTVDRFLSQRIDQEEDLRDILADISGRPREFVFKDDVGSATLQLVP